MNEYGANEFALSVRNSINGTAGLSWTIRTRMTVSAPLSKAGFLKALDMLRYYGGLFPSETKKILNAALMSSRDALPFTLTESDITL